MAEEMGILEYSSDVAKQDAPPILPAGDYPATIETIEMKTSNSNGRNYLGVVLRVGRDDFPADFDPNSENYPEGATLNHSLFVVEDTARGRYNMKKWCESIGAKMGKRVDPNEWIGLTCKVGVNHRKYEGENRLNVSKVTSL